MIILPTLLPACKLVFSNPLLGLALMAVVIGVFILLYSIIQEERVAKNDEPFRGIDK